MVATEHKITKLWVKVQFDDEDDRDLYNGEKDSNHWVSGRMTKQQKVTMTFRFLSQAAESQVTKSPSFEEKELSAIPQPKSKLVRLIPPPHPLM